MWVEHKDILSLWGGTALLLGKRTTAFVKCLTMAPEAHGAHVLPDPDYGPKYMICLNYFSQSVAKMKLQVQHVNIVHSEP